MQNDTETPLSGLQPLEVTISDAQGSANEFSGYYSAKNGLLDVGFTAALNDKPGRWTITVKDLTAGISAEASFEVSE